MPGDRENLDGLNFLTGKDLKFLCEQARLGTRLAHVDGGVPNLTIQVQQADAYHVGGLLYFFELACGLSGYLLGVNPFDQRTKRICSPCWASLAMRRWEKPCASGCKCGVYRKFMDSVVAKSRCLW